MANSKKHERTCAICGKKYYYCPACDEYDHMEPWHLRWCSASCKDIDTILSYWGAKEISSEEAAERLKSCDVSHIDSWPKSYKDAYDQIMVDIGKVKPEPVAPVEEQPIVTEENHKEETVQEAPVVSVPEHPREQQQKKHNKIQYKSNNK